MKRTIFQIREDISSKNSQIDYLREQISELEYSIDDDKAELKKLEFEIREWKSEVQKQNAEWLWIKDVSSLSTLEKSLLNFEYHLHY